MPGEQDHMCATLPLSASKALWRRGRHLGVLGSWDDGCRIARSLVESMGVDDRENASRLSRLTAPDRVIIDFFGCSIAVCACLVVIRVE